MGGNHFPRACGLAEILPTPAKHAVTGSLLEIDMKNTNEAFINDVIPSDLLETVIDWIKENLKPGDVFEEFELFDWCKANCTDAAEVCPCDLLHDWAMDHDYVREE